LYLQHSLQLYAVTNRFSSIPSEYAFHRCWRFSNLTAYIEAIQLADIVAGNLYILSIYCICIYYYICIYYCICIFTSSSMMKIIILEFNFVFRYNPLRIAKWAWSSHTSNITPQIFWDGSYFIVGDKSGVKR